MLLHSNRAPLTKLTFPPILLSFPHVLEREREREENRREEKREEEKRKEERRRKMRRRGKGRGGEE